MRHLLALLSMLLVLCASTQAIAKGLEPSELLADEQVAEMLVARGLDSAEDTSHGPKG